MILLAYAFYMKHKEKKQKAAIEILKKNKLIKKKREVKKKTGGDHYSYNYD